MSEGSFVNGVYGRANGSLHNIRVQPETLTMTVGGVANASAGAAADSPFPAVVSRGRRQKGLNARLIRFEVTNGGTTDVEQGSILSLPWLDPDTFDDAVEPLRKAVVYRDGITGEVSGSTAENLVG